MYWLYGAYIVSIVFTLFIGLSRRQIANVNGGIQPQQRYNPFLMFLYTFPLVYVAACRYSFWDTSDYRLMYDAIGTSFGNAFNNTVQDVEEGYLLFTVLLNNISRDSQLLIVVSSIFIICIICFFLYKESTDLALSLLIFSSQIWMNTMNGLRQYMVVAALLLAWRKWVNNKQTLKNDLILCLEILLMSTFHKSVLICIPLLFCARGKLFNKKVMICAIGAIAMAVITPFYNLIFNFLLGSTSYADFYETSSTMGISRFITSCLPIVMIVLYYALYIKKGNNESNKMTWIMNLSCIGFAFNILALKMVYFARISMFFTAFDLIVIPYCINKCFSKESLKIVKIVLYIFYIYFFYRQMIAFGGFATDFKLFYEVL